MADAASSRPRGGLRRTVTRWLNSVPLARAVARQIYSGVLSRGFAGSADYWERRYRAGRDSGDGSYGRLAIFKAEVLNRFVQENAVETVIEFGCGDSAQLSLAEYPCYCGLDVSPAAVQRCRERFRDDPTKTFRLPEDPRAAGFDLALSLDVIYHLVEDSVFDAYMRDLFASSRCYVIIYSSNVEMACPEPYIRHRRFTDWVDEHLPEWRLHQTIKNRHPFDQRDPENTSFADFYVFQRPDR